MSRFLIGEVAYLAEKGDRGLVLRKAYVPPKHPVGWKQGITEPRPQNPKAEFKEMNLIGGNEAQSRIPNTEAKYFGGQANKPSADPARRLMHNAYQYQELKGKPVPNAVTGKKVAIVMMGGPASGKTTMLNHVMNPEEASKFVSVNADDAKSIIPQYRQGIRGKYAPTANQAHEESSYAANRLLNHAIKMGKHVLLDGTGANAQKHGQKIQRLKDNGYHVHLMYMEKPYAQGVSDAAGRANRTGRYVNPVYQEHAYENIPKAFPELSQIAHSFEHYRAAPDGAPRGTAPTLVAKNGDRPMVKSVGVSLLKALAQSWVQ